MPLNKNPINQPSPRGGGYVFASNGQPYSGKVMDVGGSMFTTTGNTKESNSQKVITQRDYNEGKAR